MLKFVLIYTIYSASGVGSADIVDHGMSADDCTNAVTEYVMDDPELSQGIPSCEPDIPQTMLGFDEPDY